MFHYFPSKEKLYKELVVKGLSGTKLSESQSIEKVIDFFIGFTTMLFVFKEQQPTIAKHFVLMAEAQRSEAIPRGFSLLEGAVKG